MAVEFPTDPRGRLLAGLALAIVEKGYAAATIADVVRHARVSKRTFYEHFADKEACYLAVYAAVGEHLLAVIAHAAAQERDWRARVEASARAYLTEVAANPALTRTFLMEIQAAGPAALAARRAVLDRFAAQLCDLTGAAAREGAPIAPLTPALATAIVGGINELMLQAVEQGRTDALPDLTGAATELIVSVAAQPAPSP